MKVLSLNTWGGGSDRDVRLQQPLLDFVSQMSTEVDVFCFQEIWAKDPELAIVTGERLRQSAPWFTNFRDLMSTLPGFIHVFHQNFAGAGGLAMFYQKNLKALTSGDFFVHESSDFIPQDDQGHHARNIQYVTFETSRGKRTVMNFHGLWRHGAGKTDLPERLEQSRKMATFVSTLGNPFVILGDFNLMPDTESLKILEETGIRNLIKERGITSTRTSYYKKPDRYADYALVSPGIVVNAFEVLPDEVSDHAPLFLDFD